MPAALHLHYFPSNASLAPHLLLEELGVLFELVLVDRTRDAHKSPAYLKLNPNGQIPVLVDGDLVLYETAAICLHLVDTHPAAGLAPMVGTPERAHFYKWLVWMTNTLQPMLMTYFYPERCAETADAVAQVKLRAELRCGPMLDQLDAELARHGKAWLLGERFSAVDPYLLMLGRWTRSFARPARSLPHLGPVPRARARAACGAAGVRERRARPAAGVSHSTLAAPSARPSARAGADLGGDRRPLETICGIFAIGDVRSSSVKRVAAAVGEGAQVVATLHAFLDAFGHEPKAMADHGRA